MRLLIGGRSVADRRFVWSSGDASTLTRFLGGVFPFPVEASQRTRPCHIRGHPHSPLSTRQTAAPLIHLISMTRTRSTSDPAKASRADGEHQGMARRNRVEVVVADEVGVYHRVQRVVHRAFLCGVDSLSGNSYDHRRTWIWDERAEPLTTAMATPQTAAVATKRVSSGRARRASDRGLLPMTLESYLKTQDESQHPLISRVMAGAEVARIDPSQTGAVIPVLVNSLNSDDAFRRGAVADELGALGKHAKPVPVCLVRATRR